MKFEIVPPQGVRGIKFGSSIEKIRRQFGPGFQPFKRSLDNAVPSDYYPNLGLFAYYKKSGELEAVEFERPIHVMFDGMDLLKVSFNTVRTHLRSRDKELEEDYDSVTSYALGIGVWAPEKQEHPLKRCERVIVFPKGYYDEFNLRQAERRSASKK